MPCTAKKTFEVVHETGNYLLVQLKANQSNLLETARTIAADNLPSDTAFSRTKGRSRQEDRAVEVFPVSDALAGTEWQPLIKTVIRITRSTLLYSAATGLWGQRQETAFYVSSAADYPATEWAAAIRGHWGIENRNHYVRDVSCNEDQSRIRDNPGIMARARSFALNILRKNNTTNVAHALWCGALSLDHILAYKEI